MWIELLDTTTAAEIPVSKLLQPPAMEVPQLGNKEGSFVSRAYRSMLLNWAQGGDPPHLLDCARPSDAHVHRAQSQFTSGAAAKGLQSDHPHRDCTGVLESRIVMIIM